jgi:hypothetical protein
MEPASEPVSPCLYVLAGWLLASAQLGSAQVRIDGSEAAARMPAGARSPSETDPDRMSPRELRRLPAIGSTRALAIARARWERGLTGGPEAWEDIPGIGPETVRAIRRALDAQLVVPRVVRTP